MPLAPLLTAEGLATEGHTSHDVETVSQGPDAPKVDLIRRELADAVRREWGRLSEHADELSATAEAVVTAVESGTETTRHAARLRAAALAAAATRASVVLGDVQRVAGRLEGLATAIDELQPDEPLEQQSTE